MYPHPGLNSCRLRVYDLRVHLLACSCMDEGYHAVDCVLQGLRCCLQPPPTPPTHTHTHTHISLTLLHPSVSCFLTVLGLTAVPVCATHTLALAGGPSSRTLTSQSSTPLPTWLANKLRRYPGLASHYTVCAPAWRPTGDGPSRDTSCKCLQHHNKSASVSTCMRKSVLRCLLLWLLLLHLHVHLLRLARSYTHAPLPV
jgi:hypothetical protein